MTAARAIVGLVTAVATAIATIGLVLLLFINPIWVNLETGRAGSERLLVWSRDDVTRVSDAVLSELYLGPATFAVVVNGEPAFNDRERGHLVDVRAVLGLALGATGLALAWLLARWMLGRDPLAFWRQVSLGSASLAIAVFVVGLGFALAFDTAFEIFHRTFFPVGTYTFDYANDHLVQLYPEQFWSETAVLLTGTILLAAVGVAVFARRRSRDPAPADASAPVSADRASA
jgi:integral membrane protein (TIGR01906 family)